MEEIILYTLSECPNCAILKEKLHIAGYDFEERPMDTAENLTDLRYIGFFGNTAPVLRVGDNFFEYTQCSHENFFSELMNLCGEENKSVEEKMSS